MTSNKAPTKALADDWTEIEKQKQISDSLVAFGKLQALAGFLDSWPDESLGLENDLLINLLVLLKKIFTSGLKKK